MKYLANLDLRRNELQNAVVHPSTSAPATPVKGQIYFDSSNGVNKLKVYTGTAWEYTAGLVSASGTAPMTASLSNGTLTISISAATQSAAGSMSAADKLKLDGGTSSNTASALVRRDASGNFSAGTITADIAGNATSATNADKLDNQHGTYYLDRANHTGTQTAETISDFAASVQATRLDQFADPTAAVALNAQRLTGLATPIADEDAATKAYVDASAQGLSIKDAVRIASTGDLTLSGEQTIDGVSAVAGDRILVKNQTLGAENGIYVVAAGVWGRATDADSAGEIARAFVFVTAGTANGDSGWALATTGTITLGVTSLAFAQFSAAGQVEAGAALTKTGNTLDVIADDVTIEVSADALQLKDGGTATAKIANLAVTKAKVAADVAGTGLAKDVDGSLKVVTDGTTLEVFNDAVQVKDGGITAAKLAVGAVTKDNVAASVAGSGLTQDADGSLMINADGVGLEAVNDTLQIKDGGVGEAKLGALSVTKAKIAADVAGDGLVKDETSGALTIVAAADGGVAVDEDGVAVVPDGVTLELSEGALQIKGAYRVAKYAANVGDAEATAIVISHNLGSQDVVVTVRETAAPYEIVYPDVTITSANTLTLTFAVAPALEAYRVVVIG
jgi:hypothetical protein